MLNKIKFFLYLIPCCIFIFLITFYYFSEKNVIKTNKFRSLYIFKVEENFENLPLLKNDTHNIIEYKNSIETYKKNKKKYKFWNLLGQ